MIDPKDEQFYEFKRILVIEDEPHIRKIICSLLRQIGFQRIDEAEDGSSGFQELLRVKPDLILCDIYMKPMDGMSFLRRLRGLDQPEFSDIPVVFLTADGQLETVLAARELNIDGYLVKPVSLKSLKDRVNAALNL